MYIDFDDFLADNNITVLKANIGKQVGLAFRINEGLILTENKTKLVLINKDQNDVTMFLKALKASNATHRIPGEEEIWTYKNQKWVETTNQCKIETTGNIVKGFTREEI